MCPQVDVRVMSHQLQRYAVWFGGSVLAMASEFPQACHSRADYMEYGPSIARRNYVFREL
jgi:actin-related protein 3